MAKRKTGVKDIIYELDDDIEISSEDEGTETKVSRIQTNITLDLTRDGTLSQESDVQCDNLVILNESDTESSLQTIGGKTPSLIITENSSNVISVNSQETENEVVNSEKLNTISMNNTEDTDVGYWDETPAGCENRTPLLTVRFKNKKIASDYKKQIKEFMIKLIKLHEEDSYIESGNETDLELDIWPEDLNESIDEDKDVEDGLFFVDTDPCGIESLEVPNYKQTSKLITNIPDKEPTPPPTRRKQSCFNCDGEHQLKECPLPRNNSRISEKRKNFTKLGRYHIEDEQKYGHLVPGRISGLLRHALNLKRHELPLHIYRMRQLGYPPGWLEEARISHSGITMFDSTGNAILEPEEEEGQCHEPGSRDKFDIKKILDYPGFNVPASSRYKEEAHLYGLPPMSEQDSKILMLQTLAPNAMKAYKRKKLTLFPSSTFDSPSQEGQVEMELDSGDEASFPSVPPLPDDAPPPIPPPPASPPPPSSSPTPAPTLQPQEMDQGESTQDEGEKSMDDMEITEIIEVKNIPVPADAVIVVDDEDDEKLPESSKCSNMSLQDLEEKRRLILSALECGDASDASTNILQNNDVLTEDNNANTDIKENIDTIDHVDNADDNNVSTGRDESVEVKSTNNKKENTDTNKVEKENLIVDSEEEKQSTNSESPVATIIKPGTSDDSQDKSDVSKTPLSKFGHVKTTNYGTPVLNIVSPYVKLPSDVNFAKDICDVIYFENLPNSTGKFKKISNLLKKVKKKVDRIQES